jgi:hypothetical protein
VIKLKAYSSSIKCIDAQVVWFDRKMTMPDAQNAAVPRPNAGTKQVKPQAGPEVSE